LIDCGFIFILPLLLHIGQLANAKIIEAMVKKLVLMPTLGLDSFIYVFVFGVYCFLNNVSVY